MKDHAEDMTKFAVNLYRKLAQEGNLIYSPYSIYQAFLMVMLVPMLRPRLNLRVLEIDDDDDEDVHT